jgi:hypothetical protein
VRRVPLELDVCPTVPLLSYCSTSLLQALEVLPRLELVRCPPLVSLLPMRL